MPHARQKLLTLSKAEARLIWLRAQRLDEATPFGNGPEATPAAVEHLGYVQIDLSPFDPLIIQRKRLKLFFGYEHLFEAYVPKEKRRWGCFALPVLVDDEIVAAIDLKADREKQALLVQQWTWISTNSGPSHKRRIEEALHRFGKFQFDR